MKHYVMILHITTQNMLRKKRIRFLQRCKDRHDEEKSINADKLIKNQCRISRNPDNTDPNLWINHECRINVEVSFRVHL